MVRLLLTDFSSLYSVLLIMSTQYIGSCSASSKQCAEVRTAYVNMGFSSMDVPTHSLALQCKFY